MKGFLIFTDKHRGKIVLKMHIVTDKLYPNIYNNHNNIYLNEDISQNNNKDKDKNICSKIDDEINNPKKIIK